METPTKEAGNSSFQPLERSISLPGRIRAKLTEVGGGDTTSSTVTVTGNDGEATEQISLDQVSQLMREEDADLLESMHYASSQVSQYSPGGTPILRPKDRSLPMEDVPLMLMPVAATSDLLMQKESSDTKDKVTSSASASSTSETRTTSLHASFNQTSTLVQPSNVTTGLAVLSAGVPSLHSQSLHERSMGEDLGTVDEDVTITDNYNDTDTVTSKVSKNGDGAATAEQTSPVTDKEGLPAGVPGLPGGANARFRRLLSGEIRPMEEKESKHDKQTTAEEEEEETTASPISVAQEATTTALQQHHKKESGLAEQRRVSEAIQFAEAVGEKISIGQDKLCIIEDSTEGEESDDDDDACESKEIVLGDGESIHDAMSTSQAKSVGGHAEEQVVVVEENTSILPSHVDVPPTPTFARRKTKRPNWPFGPAGSDYDKFLDHLSDGLDQSDFVYKGICANPPEITKRGMQRGNYAQLHRKAWLEVSDKYHRYGKNLRQYYRLWERFGFPTNQFFDWLDSKGEAAGQPLPNVDECPRSVLDSDTVLYISNPEVTEGYALDVICSEDGKGRIVDVDGSPVETGQDGWIFVLRDNVMYGAQKITSINGHSKQRFHHSSFFGGKAVAAAGIIITDSEGYLTRLYPHSGHYRPGESHMQRMLFFLHRAGVDLRTFHMDTQQFRHVSREMDAGKNKSIKKEEKTKEGKEGEKKKKINSLHMERAVNVACFLAHKASFIGSGIFDKIHKIRKADATSVTEALDLVDGGGHWQPKRQDEPHSVSHNLNVSIET